MMDMQTHAEQETERVGRAASAVSDMYAHAAQTAAEYVQAVVELPARSMGDWQDYQRTWIDWVGRATEFTARATRDFAGCRDLRHFLEMQRHYMQEGRRHLLEAGTHLLDVSTRVGDATGNRIGEAMREAESTAVTGAKRRRAA